jgi:hypothetical protein
MALPTIPAANSDATQRNPGATQPFTVQWWNFFNNLLTYINTGPIGPVPLVGVTDGSNAAAGNIGEYLHSFVLAGAAVNILNNTDTQITSLALTAGDWDLYGEIFFQPNAATITQVTGAIGTSVNSGPTVPNDGADRQQIPGQSLSSFVSTNALRTRVSITAPATYILTGYVLFTGTSVAGYGALRARRVR